MIESANIEPQVIESDSVWSGEAVAKIVAVAVAAERERCAKIAESVACSEYIGKGISQIDRNHEIIKIACVAAAAAIRKDRGSDPPQVETK